MSWRGRQLKRPRIRAGGFYFSRGFAARVPGSYKTAMLRRLRIMENYHAFISDIVFQHEIKSDHHTLHVAVILFWKEQRWSESRPLSKFIVLCFTLRTYILLLKICKSLFNRGSTALIPIASSQMIPVSYSFLHCLFLYFSFLCYVMLFSLLL